MAMKRSGSEYGGSRREKQRFEYSEGSRSAFVELIPSCKPTPEDFKKYLEDVPGVSRVEWHTRYLHQEQNLLVYSSTGPGSVNPPIEFELTRNQH